MGIIMKVRNEITATQRDLKYDPAGELLGLEMNIAMGDIVRDLFIGKGKIGFLEELDKQIVKEEMAGNKSF